MSHEVLVFSVLGLNFNSFLWIADNAADQDEFDLNPWPYVFVEKSLQLNPKFQFI
jgi:hypothetical protein